MDWSWLSNLFALSPAEEQQYHELQVEMGYADPTPAEAHQMLMDDISNYLEYMPTEKDVWYDGGFTRYYQYYKIDQFGHRHNISEVFSEYCGHTGEPPDPSLLYDYIDAEVLPVYKRLQG